MGDLITIFNSMANLIKLTLSIRDTPDCTFAHGPKFESIFVKYLPHLSQFDYAMTHRMNEQTSIEDCIRWPITSVYYQDENAEWVHVFSLPWPSNKGDKRQLYRLSKLDVMY